MASARGAEAYRVAPKCGFSSGSTAGRPIRGGCCPSGTPPELRLHAAILSPLSIRSLLGPNSGDACLAPRARAAAPDGDEDRYRALRHGVEAVRARRPAARGSGDVPPGTDGRGPLVLRHRRRRAGGGGAARRVDAQHPVGHRRRQPAGSLPLHRPGAAVRRAHHADARRRRPLTAGARHPDRRVPHRIGPTPRHPCLQRLGRRATRHQPRRHRSCRQLGPSLLRGLRQLPARGAAGQRCCAAPQRCPAAPS